MKPGYLEVKCILTTFSNTGRRGISFLVQPQITGLRIHPSENESLLLTLELSLPLEKLHSTSSGRSGSPLGEDRASPGKDARLYPLSILRSLCDSNDKSEETTETSTETSSGASASPT